MGVPKFFRYISERYPCLSEFVKEYQIPVFDNLYLDMNGIIHMCSHPDDNNPHFRITEEKIFADIFHYIEVLFRMIKPQKVFFMAVDGVAPRAKMNQQRGRRFRSAKDAEKLQMEAMRKGEKLPEGERFDSNCITPGTEFMARLHDQLKYFVVHKISTDKMWKKCKIILSGHETPGEGEHKIMDYIRYIRSQPGYDPNTRHCLYGLDADLIMLGLCTHDPHFSLLREEVKFGKKSKRSNVPEEIRFYLLHLSLMREYLELEFAPLKEKLKESDKVSFDIEKIIDDWILMGFLVGNDFIPNLPNLHIANGALPVLYEAYMEVLPTLDGYVNEAGTLNLERFEKFMKKLADIDMKNFVETQDDLLYMKMKTGRKQVAHTPVQSKIIQNENEETTRCQDPALAELIQLTDELDVSSEGESDKKSTSSEDEAFKTFKDEYYRNKLEYQKVTPEVMREQAEGYVRAIQWNLNYYYNGVCSWSWFYPHHYSPYISDIKGFSDLKIEFELGKPFKPYEQLLAVLPTASKIFLPKCYHDLMTDDNSLIKAYYPEEFQTDLNGKRQEWEAVVLVPFIDENVLLEAMQPCNELLTLEEIKRNTHGPMLVYEYVEDDLGVYNAPDYFPNIVRNQARCTSINVEDIRVPKEKLVKGAYPGARFDVFYPGFPTLKHLKYESKLKKSRVKVFETPSRNENLILKILPNELYFGDSIPLDLLGKTIWVAWPHLVEAKVVAISNKKEKYINSNDEIKKFYKEERTGNLASLFDSELEGITRHYRERLGIDFGQTEILVHVQTMIGRKYVFTSNRRITLEKQFSSIISNYPLQSIVHDIAVYDECHSAYADVSDVFPMGSLCFSLTNPYYGSQGTIMDSKESLKNNQLKVSLVVVDEPDFSAAQKIDEKLKNSYLNLTNCASQLTLSNYVFSRITGSLFISTRSSEGLPKTVNIGLDLKFNKKNQETPGYTKKIDNTWFYTKKAVALVREYIEKFPEVFIYLSTSNADDIIADELFGTQSEEKVKSIQTWLKTLPIHNIERRVCGSMLLEPEVIAEIEKTLDQMQESPKNITMNIKPHLLFKPEIQMGNLPPDFLAKTKVFDRIVNVREGFTVPLGLKGTVIAVHKSPNLLKDDDEMFDIVFDKIFTGGMALNCSEHRGYRLPKTSFINLTFGKRQMEQKTGVPGALLALARERRHANNFNVSSNNNGNVNTRQQNSAFASFNKVQANLNVSSHNKNIYAHTGNQYPVRTQPNMNSTHYDQNKAKNSFYYLTDFTNTFEPKFSKENVGMRKNSEVNVQSKQTTKGLSNAAQKPSHSKAKTEVDTDFLKRILNIENNVGTSTKCKPNVPPPKEVIRIYKGVPNNQEQIPVPPNEVVRNCAVAYDKNQQTPSTSATARLLSYYQSNLLGCPRYTYLDGGTEVSAQVVLPNGEIITGRPAKSREEASENVALDAFNMLKNFTQRLPSEFPVPPTKWMQERHLQNKMQSNVYVNTSYQMKHPGHSQRPRITVNLMEYNRKHSGPNFSKNNEVQQISKDSTSANSHNFVPLQALKKKQGHVNRTVSNSKNQSDKSVCSKQENGNLTKTTRGEGMSKAQGVDTKERKAGRHRRTRIAANFNK